MKKKYCCFCGTKLTLKPLSDGSEEKYCAQCDHVFFETPYPAVIVAVATNNKVLVNERGLIAGYIRQGETAEQAAIRETREEVGLEISNLTFVNTYSAKKGNLLMIGYKAKAKDAHVKRSSELRKAVCAIWTNRCPYARDRSQPSLSDRAFQRQEHLVLLEQDSSHNDKT